MVQVYQDRAYENLIATLGPPGYIITKKDLQAGRIQIESVTPADFGV